MYEVDVTVFSGPVHTNAFSFENAYFFIRFRLPSTLIRSKTEVYDCENGGFRKRSLEWRFLKTEVQRLCVDGRKRLRHWHWHVPDKNTKRMFSYPFSVVKCGRSKTLAWTKNFLSVFKKQKTEVFENALVWTGPQWGLSVESVKFKWIGEKPTQNIHCLTESFPTSHKLSRLILKRN